MKRIYQIYKKDMRHVILNKILILLFAILIVTLIIMDGFSLSSSVIIKINTIMNILLKIIMVYYGIEIFAKDYFQDSSKIIFTIQEERWKIYVGKLLANMSVGLYISILYIIAQHFMYRGIGIKLQLNTVLYEIIAFTILEVCVASFSILITLISGKYIITFILNYLIFFESVSQMMSVTGNKMSNRFIGSLLENNIFKQLNDVFELQNIQNERYKYLFLFILFNFVLGNYLLQKKDIA